MDKLLSTHSAADPSASSDEAPPPPADLAGPPAEDERRSPARISDVQLRSRPSSPPTALKLGLSSRRELEVILSQRDRVQVVVSEEGDLLYRLDELEASFAQHLCDELRCFLADSGAIGRWGARSAEAEHDGIRVRVSPLEGKCGGQCGGVQLVEIDRAPEKTTWEDFPLSPRQRQVGVAAASGETVPQIAARLQLSTNTVKAHLKRVYEVVGVHSRVELASRF